MVGAPFSQDARDNFEGITRNVQDYVIWGERVTEIQEKINKETDPKKLFDYNTELSNYKAKIAEASGELQKWANNITESDSASQQMKQNLQNDIEYMNQFLYTAQELNKIEFDKVFNAEDFASAKARLLELAEAGEVTPTVIESYKEFNDLMAKTGLTAQQIADEINGSVQKQKDNTVQAFSDLTAKFSDAVSALELLDAAYKKVSQGQSLTAQEVVNLVNTYPELESAVIKTADGFLIEKDALEKVAGSSDNLKINHIQAQIEMTRNLLEQSSERLSALNVELDGIKSLADAYAQLAGGNGKYYGMTYREYRTRGISGDDGPKMTEAEFNQMQLEMGKDVKNVLAYGAALDKLSSAQERLKNITIPMGGSSKSGGSKSSGSKKDPQKEYEENVKKYKAAVEDIIQTDEEWNEHEKKMGRLSDVDFYGNMARRADTLRKEADKVLNVEWMAYQDRQKLRADFIKEAELIEYDYKEGYVGMADEVVKAEKDALEERFDASEKYIEDCNRENKWGEDNEVAALERILAYHLENFDTRKKIIEGYYADGTYTREQFEKRMDELDDEREEKTRDLGARIYDKAKEQGEEYFNEVSKRIKEQYGKELEFEKEKWEAIAEYRSNAMLQEVERLENQLKKQTAKIDAQLEELADALEAFDRRMEDEHDDRKLKRLQYNLEYESDEDNRRSLEKEIEKLEEEIAEKKFKRDIADQQDALNEKKDRINEEMQYEIDAAKKAGDEMVASAKTRIDRINEYYNNKMSAANIANELVSGLAANGEKFEYAGEVMGELMATGISKTLDGYLNGIYSSIGNLGVKMNRGAASHEMVHRVVNNNQSYTTNITTTKPVSPAEARKYAKKWQKINELESGV